MPHSMSVPLFNYADSNFIVHHTVSENFEDPYTRLHMHTMYELYCFLDGEGVFTVEGNIYKLERGMLLLIRPGEAHSAKIVSTSRYERIAVHFTPSFLENDCIREMLHAFETSKNSSNHCFFCNDESAYPFKLLHEITNPKLISDHNACKLALLTNLPALLYSLSENCSHNVSVDGTSHDRLVRQILRFIDSHLSSEWSLDELAEHLYRDKAYLNRRFKTVVGTSIWNYTIQKRIVNAQRSLYATGSISSAFQASGFSDYSTFYRNYNRIIGISPSDDLKNRKSDKERLLGIINPYC